jgi:uncharacterized protein (DUF2141 family)
LVILTSLSRCASVGSPDGGPRDTIPPTLVKAIPSLNATNYKGRTIALEFNEDIKQNNLQQQLLISPRTDIRYKTKINKNTVVLEFEESFADSTTYTFNFRDGLGDLNEGNAVEMLYLAFSTGNYIDSLKIEGTVTNLFTGQAAKQATLALYSAKDTLNVEEDKPLYYTQASDAGTYELRNLKPGRYLLYAYADKNNNLTLQTKSEAYGYVSDTLVLADSSNLSNIDIAIYRANSEPLRLNAARPAGTYFELTYNKGLYEISFNTNDSLYLPQYSLTEENKKVRFYPRNLPQDSLTTIVLATDSIGQTVQDTISIQFRESERKPAAFEVSVEPENGKTLPLLAELTLNFSKPVSSWNTDSLVFRYDSVNVARLDTAIGNWQWNTFKDKLTIIQKLSPPKPPADTTQTKAAQQGARALVGGQAESTKQEVILYSPKGTFISVEGDSLKEQQLKYTLQKAEAYGTLKGKIQPTDSAFILQLVNTSDKKIIRELTGSPADYEFNWLPAGTYQLRVIFDENKNGRWDAGNLATLSPAEKVVIVPEAITLKENWVVEQPILNVNKPVNTVETADETSSPAVELEQE